MNGSRAIFIGALWMTLAVGLGAFGAHGLADVLDRLDTADTFQTAVRYQAWHSLGLIALGLLTLEPRRAQLGRAVGWLFVGGIVCFSGSLVVLALEPSATWLGPVTPIGGALFLAGWVGFASVALKLGREA